ncbi:MAG: DUF1990 domain-containing protein [Bacteroidota bacterium]
MPVYLTVPTPTRIEAFLRDEEKLSCTYEAVGISRQDKSLPGFDNDHSHITLGQGELVWERACIAIREWAHFPFGWTRIVPAEEEPREGQTVAVLIHLFGLWWLNSARVVYTIEEKNRFGFAYGTLPGHVEMGEEAFWVQRDAEGVVSYHIKAFSKPRMWLTKIGYPVVRMCQKRFVRHSMRQMHRIAGVEKQKLAV